MSDALMGKVCVVTGATGIAAAAALQMGNRGATVAVISRESDECEQLAETLRSQGIACAWWAADLTDDSAAVAAFDGVLDRFETIDGLFAVAGGSGRRFGDGPIHELTLEGWNATFHINGVPAFLAVREAVRAMRSSGGGSIAVVSSVLAEHPAPDMFGTHAYAATKASVRGLVRTVAATYASDGIRVNGVAPGLVATPMAARAAGDPAIVAYAAQKQPLAGGLLTAEDVAAVGVFLMSDAARMITGQVIDVDGGWGVTEARG